MPESMNISDHLTRYHKIEDQLYLGDIKAALDADTLKTENIQLVVTLLPFDIEANKVPGMTYHQIRLNDDPNEEVLTYFPQTFRIISEAQKSGKNVLVHCYVGVSRSATFVIAFLMNKHKKPYKEIRNRVEEIRKKINPNEGFVRQLILYEQIGFKIDANNKKLRQYFLETILFNKDINNSIDRYFQKMVLLERVSENEVVLGRSYLCYKCGYNICNEINIIKKTNMNTDKTCAIVYIEARDWMREKIFDIFTSEKKSSHLYASCPSCKEIVVSFRQDFKSYKCDCDQHKRLKCLYFVLRESKFKV